MSLVLPPIDRLRERTSAKWRAYPADVLPAWVAEMDVETAEPIAAALRAAIDRSDLGYRWAEGLPEALAGFSADAWGWHLDPASVFTLPDVLTGLEHALRILTAPGEGVIINSPVYHPFWSTIRDVVGRPIVDVPLARDEQGAYRLDLDAMAQAFARRDVTAWVLCSPHNPTGTVPSADELGALAVLAEQHGVAVIADEIHAPLVYPGVVHTPFAMVAPAGLVFVTLISASKGWNLAGLKCAQLVAGDADTAQRFTVGIPMEATFATGHLGVLASIAAYTQGRAWLDDVRDLIAANAMLIEDVLAARVPEAGFVAPQASYLGWIDCTALGLGDNPARVILDQGRLALSAGHTFGGNGAGFIRLNFGTSPSILHEILDRLVGVLAAR